MEATKKVGGPNPSGPQGHPSAGSQQSGGGLRGSQGPWISSGPLYFQQGLSLSTETIIDGACCPVSLAHVPEPIHQLLQNPAEVSSQGGYDQPSQEVLRFSTASVFSRPIVGAQPRLVMDDGTMSLPVCTPSDGISDAAQHRLCHSRLQVRLREEGKAPSKVLVGWGKGPCSPDPMVPPGTRKSRWLPYFISGEDNADKDQGPLPTPAVALAQDQGQGQGLHPAQAPSIGAAPSLPVAPAAPAQADTPALGGTPMPVAAETHPGTPDHLPDTNTANQDLPQDGRSVFLESSNSSHQDKGDFHSKEGPPIPAPPLEEFPDHAQEHKVAGRQGPLEQPEDSVEKPQVYTSGLGSSTPGLEPPGTPKSRRTNQEMCSSQPDKQPLNICNKTSSNVPVPPYGVTYPGQFPVQAPREAMPILSSAPTCQLREAVEDRVLVFDMATGSTRMGLLCHDPMGSRAVLVGLMPSHPSTYAPENTLPTRPLARPFLSPEGNSSSFWPTASVLSSPVPSSLSSGSYREVALVPKEARLNLESRDSPGTESPLRVGVLAGPVPLLMPLQFGERRLTHVPDPSWPKQDAEKNEPSHTIWKLDSSRLPDAALAQTKKLQWMNSEPVPPASTQEVPRSLPPEGTDSHNQKEVITAHPDNPQAKGSGQAPLIGQPILNGQALLPGQPPSTKKQPSLSDQPPLAGKTPLGRQLSLTRQAPLTEETIVSNEPPIIKEPTLTRGPPTTGESGQASTQEGEPLGLSTNMGVLRVTPAPEETWGYLGGEKVGMGSTRSLSMHGVSSRQPGSSPRSGRFKLTAEDVTHSSVVTHLGLLRGTCYELVSTMEAVPVQSPVLYRHSLGPYEDMAAVVIDTGTGFTKCGLAGEDHVLSVIPSQVQLLQHASQGQPRYAVPEDREGSHPVLNRGVVSDWDALEVLWQHLFYCRLGVQPEELAVLVADSPISPRTNREKVAEILFERFHVPAMQTVHQALLALYACGRTTGLVLGSGHGTSYVAPILTGDLAPLDTYRLDVAGADLTEYLAQLLAASGQSLPKAGLANQIKEAACYVAMNMAAERACTKDQARVDFVLPDKQVITLGSERFCCPEALFQPNLLGLNQPGLPQLALLSISRLEAKQQEQLLANVVLEGGSTLLSGFPERLKQELGPHASVLSSPHRAVAAWLGGSIMASRDSFQSLWLRRREYEEEGPWAIYKYQL